MTVEREPNRSDGVAASAAEGVEKPRTWILPLVFLAVVTIPAVILVLSNTDSQQINFAGFTWEAPLWIILAATFLAGALLTRAIGWAWTVMRRRSRRKRAEYDQARRATEV